MSTQNAEPKKKKRFKFPHPVVIMFTLVLILAILSWFIPAGQYTMVEDPVSGRMVVDPDSYTVVESNPIGFFEFFQAFPQGMVDAAEITFFIMITAAAFNVITATGAVNAGIARVSYAFRNQAKLMIPAILTVFSVGGVTFGMAEEVIVFVPIGIALAIALGFDAMVGTAVVVMGAACGFCAGVMNPFTVGVAQSIAELPTFSGWELRLVVLIAMLVVTSAYLMRYANRIKKDPTKSVLYGEKVVRNQDELSNVPKMSLRQIIILFVVLAGFLLLIYGVVTWGWYISELAALFLAMGVISGLIYGFTPTEVCTYFMQGVTDIATGAIMCGIARAILTVMEVSMIKDTVIHALAGAIAVLPRSVAVVGMYIVQLLVDFLIPSGSGQAAATMPIMTPIADVLGINRQVTVLCFQFGDGFNNNISPISGTLMATLSIAKISYDKWCKFMLPLVGMWIAMGAVFVVVANAINYGPF